MHPSSVLRGLALTWSIETAMDAPCRTPGWRPDRSAERELGGQLLAGVVQCLVDRPARRVELARERRGRDAVDRDRDHDGSLAGCQVIDDQPADGPQQLLSLGALLR